MAIKRTSHAVYDTRYHIVWAHKYRKWILRGDLRDFVENYFKAPPFKAGSFTIERMVKAHMDLYNVAI